jgi:hypothetical protein
MTSGWPHNRWQAEAARPVNARLDQLWCLHVPGGGLPVAGAVALGTRGVLLDTCLRQLAFGVGVPDHFPTPGEWRHGADAYHLLLEVATGLRSAVPGETNVQGQLQGAWLAACTRLPPDLVVRLQPVIEAVLADTRAIRRQHLQGVGGASYGSLTRALLAADEHARVLVIGAGALARSVLPWLGHADLGVWTRGAPVPLPLSVRWFAPSAAPEAAAWATHVVLTTPADAAHDDAWQTRFAATAVSALGHLGRRDGAVRRWAGIGRAFDLEDLFNLAATREQRRASRLAAALDTCRQLVRARFAAPAVDAALA